ncbi:MAG: XRE family transcriptional regulator [Bacteroidetes bacterium]|nr:MAG: XRE family transcriptional regulator [Bacteroidota bacterium]
METSKIKLTTLDELIDKHIGEAGTEERALFEYELKLDIIGQIIRETRQKKRLTQAQLGELIGVQKSQISKLENNTKNFRIDTILKVLHALGAKLKLIVELEQEEKLILD